VLGGGALAATLVGPSPDELVQSQPAARNSLRPPDAIPSAPHPHSYTYDDASDPKWAALLRVWMADLPKVSQGGGPVKRAGQTRRSNGIRRWRSTGKGFVRASKRARPRRPGPFRPPV
jgi:hypothetical protein